MFYVTANDEPIGSWQLYDRRDLARFDAVQKYGGPIGEFQSIVMAMRVLQVNLSEPRGLTGSNSGSEHPKPIQPRMGVEHDFCPR
jgi:hypothetical protein